MLQIWSYIRLYRWRWLLGMLLLLLTNLTAMAVPQILREVVDGLRTGMPVLTLQHLAAWLVGVALIGMVFRTLSRVFILHAARDVELAMRSDFYAHLTHLDPGFFQTHPTGDLMSRCTNDLTQVRLMLGPGLLNIVNTAIAYTTAIPLMLMISVKLTVIAFAMYPPALWLMRRLGKRLFQRNQLQQTSLGILSNMIQENLAGAFLVRAFAVEQEQQAHFAKLNQTYCQANLQLAWTRSGMFRIPMSLSMGATLLAVLFGAYDVLQGRLHVGDIVAMVEYMGLLSWPTFALGWVLSLWQRGMASWGRLQEIINTPPDIVSGLQVLPPAPVSLVVHRLRVQYGDTLSLVDIDFDLSAGKTLGVVGPIGSGKSTLLAAFLRLVPIASGQILLGGVDIRQLQLASLRHFFAYVPQNPRLFAKTIAENIAFGMPHATLQQIMTACSQAALLSDLQALPEGLQTEVGERGVMLSGGQKQRTAIARALLLDRQVLLLDDALSAVDTQTEAAILQSLQAVRRGRTNIIVAHRMSTVAQADHILVLHEGKLTEQGTHQSLLAQGGWYASMSHRQELLQVEAPDALVLA